MHPRREDLRDFATGKLDDEASERIEIHLRECESCNEIIEQDSASDAFCDLIKGATKQLSPNVDATVALAPSESSENASTPANPLQAEIKIDGYEIVSELGRGGMGVVYLANDLRLKRSVALKVILTGEHSSWEQRERFRVEAETIAQLRHNGIVQIYEVGEHDGHVYFALELIEGGGLQEFINDQPQGIAWSAAVVLQLAGTMHFAHQQGVVHRDLKPANVLLEPITDSEKDSGRFAWHDPSMSSAIGDVGDVPTVKITDFGLAKQLGSDSNLTRTGLVMGTPAYMAPEQTTGGSEAIGPAADIHALGAILYKLLTGKPPFEAEDVLQTLTMVMNDDPISPRSLRPDIPRDLETIILKCLNKNPADRYESAFELATDLKLFLQGEPIHARPLGLGGRIVRWARQKPALATTIAGGGLFYVIHLIMWWGGNETHKRLHYILTGIIVTWFVAASIAQRFIDDERWTLYGKYAFMMITAITLSGTLMQDRGPSSAPVQVYLLLQATSILVVPSTRMVGLSTLTSLLGYIALLCHAHFIRPETQVTFEDASAFIASIIAMGLILFLILRRSKQQSKGSEIRSSFFFGRKRD